MVIFIIDASETAKVSFLLVVRSDKVWYTKGFLLSVHDVFEDLKMNANLCCSRFLIGLSFPCSESVSFGQRQ